MQSWEQDEARQREFDDLRRRLKALRHDEHDASGEIGADIRRIAEDLRRIASELETPPLTPAPEP